MNCIKFQQKTLNTKFWTFGVIKGFLKLKPKKTRCSKPFLSPERGIMSFFSNYCITFMAPFRSVICSISRTKATWNFEQVSENNKKKIVMYSTNYEYASGADAYSDFGYSISIFEQKFTNP